MRNTKRTPEPLVVRPAIAAAMLDCGLTTIYALLKAGKLEAVHVGADQRITMESINRAAKREQPEAIPEVKPRRPRRNKSRVESKAA